MRTLQLTVQPTCSGHHSQKGVHLQLFLNLCTEGHRGQVWLYLMILSVLCRGTHCAYTGPDTTDLQTCIGMLQSNIEKSDAMLYTPLFDKRKENCDAVSLNCYMKELEMVLNEEEIKEQKFEGKRDCITRFHSELKGKINNASCLTCEEMGTTNSTEFVKNLLSFLKFLTQQRETS